MLQLTAGAATQCSQSTGRLRVRNKSAAKSASILPRKAGNAPPCRRGPSPCLAAAEKDTKQEPNLVVPDAPPGKGSTAEGAQTSTSEVQGASSQPDTERLSADEIREQMAQLRAAAKEEEKKDGFVQVHRDVLTSFV